MPAKKIYTKIRTKCKKKPTKAVAAAEQVDAATAVPNTYKHTHTHRHELLLRWCECKQKADQTRAQYTLVAVVVVVPTRIAANVEQTNQTGRAEPAARSQRQQAAAAAKAAQAAASSFLRRLYFFPTHYPKHTTMRRSVSVDSDSGSSNSSNTKSFSMFTGVASRRVVTNVARVALSCAVYVCACVSVRENERERRCLPFVKFHCQFVSYETEMALQQQQRSTTAGVAKKHVESSFFSCSLPLTHSLTHIEAARKHVCCSLKLPVTSNTKLELPACVCLSLSHSVYTAADLMPPTLPPPPLLLLLLFL